MGNILRQQQSIERLKASRPERAADRTCSTDLPQRKDGCADNTGDAVYCTATVDDLFNAVCPKWSGELIASLQPTSGRRSACWPVPQEPLKAAGYLATSRYDRHL